MTADAILLMIEYVGGRFSPDVKRKFSQVIAEHLERGEFINIASMRILIRDAFGE
jgi:hypothetical protein